MGERPRAGVGEHKPFLMPVEQLAPKLLLDFAEMLADRPNRYAQLLSRRFQRAQATNCFNGA